MNVIPKNIHLMCCLRMDFSIFIVIITIVFLTHVKGDGGGNWGYQTGKSFSSPEHWKDIHGMSCGGPRQSPINIITKSVKYDEELKSIFITKEESFNNVSLKASATSVILSFSKFWTGNFNGEGCFKPVAIHWHWGSENVKGSEHTIDSVAYVMEGHIVTYDCKLYNNFSTALSSPNGLFVFGILYKVGEQNPAIEKILGNMDDIIKNGSTTIPEISPIEFLPRNLSRYYRYEGSLTTPPCTENVVWTVFSEIQTIDNNQLSKFRSIQFGPPEDGAMVNNFRPVQLNKNQVYSSFKLTSYGFIQTYNIISLLMMLTTSFIFYG